MKVEGDCYVEDVLQSEAFVQEFLRYNLAIVGGQWGDEAKGKYTDLFAQLANVAMVARANGGANAGHNIYSEEFGGFDTHQLPSGIFNPNVMNLIGQGCMTNPVELVKEMARYRRLTHLWLESDRLMISPRAHIITPAHVLLDGIRDEGAGVGTTKQGIGPGYTDKMARNGVRAIDLINNKADVLEALKAHRKEVKRLGGKEKAGRMDGMLDFFFYAVDEISPLIRDPLPLVKEILASDKRIIAEGAQGVLLGIDTGTYPYVTSSSTTAAGVIGGVDGLPTTSVKDVLGIFKLPMSRVGSGPFVTALQDEDAHLVDKLQGEKGTPGAEYGATTGRRRDIGWFDGVAGRYAVSAGGINQAALTKLDMLDGIDELKVCEAYEINGQTVTEMPADTKQLEKAVPVYKYYKGWKQSTVGITLYDDLPPEAKAYVRGIESIIGVKAKYIGTGTDRHALIRR